MDAPAKPVFLSYASQDAEAVARIRDVLQGSGIEVWFDQSELRGGDAWDAMIRKRIKECALFIPVVSEATNARDEGYFRFEWKLAVDRSHLMAGDKAFLLPVSIGQAAQHSGRVPERFLEVQWSRLSTPEDLPALAQRVKTLLGMSGDAPAASAGAVETVRATSPGTPSVAVLPFLNMSRDEENEYFADGLTEELLNVLANIRGLRVASRTSAFYFKGKDIDLPTIARKLGVATVLEGSVRKSGKRVRITTQLIDVAADSHLWSKTYDRELDDIFAVQDDIAQSVVTELRQALLGGSAATVADAASEVKAASSGRTENAEAHELYLQGRFFLQRVGEKEIARSVDCFKKAIALDPNFALAWVELSGALWTQAAHAWVPPAEGFERARDAANRVLELLPQRAEGHVCLSRVLVSLDRDWTGATAALEKAAALAPESSFVLRAMGRHLGFLGRSEALEYLEKSVALDPLSFPGRFLLAGQLANMGRFEEAEVELARAEELNPGSSIARFILVGIRLQQGRHREALQAAHEERLPALRLSGIAMAEHSLGNAAASDEALRSLKEEHPGRIAFQAAQVHAWRGENDQAFEWLERGVDAMDAGVMGILFDPFMKSLRGDPRWPGMLKRIGLG